MTSTALRLALAVAALAVSAIPALAQTGTIGYSWQGATLANEGSGWPPDTHGAAGINHFVQAVNGGFQIYNKDGSGYAYPTNYISNHNFWTNRVGLATGVTGNQYTDPRIYFDPLSQRWFAVEITSPTGPVANRILIGRSDTADPRGAWQGVVINSQSNSFNDFPTLAVDANALYIGTNNFPAAGGGQNGRSLISIPLNGATGFLQNPTGAASVATVAHNLTVDQSGNTPHGVTDTTGATAGLSTGIVLGTGITLGAQQLSRTLVDNPGAAGATFTFPVQTPSNGGYIPIQNASASASFAPQLGGPTLDNGDNRLNSAVFRVGSLIYLTRGADAGDGTGRSVARWTVLSVDNATNAVTVVREGTIDLGGNAHAFFPSIAANERGDFVLSFSRSSPTEFPSIEAVVGTTTDHSNWSVGSPIQLQQGLTFQNIGSGGNNRWGDYSATTLDPADPGSFWVTNEYMHNVNPPGGFNENTNWGTRVVEVIPTIAGEIRWKNPANGLFATAANWQTGALPGSADHVIFSRWSQTTYRVDLPPATTTTNDRLSIRQTGTGTLNFVIAAGATWSLANPSAATPSLAIAEYQGQSNVVISGGGTLSTGHAVIAARSGGTGNLTISGAGTTWTNSGDLFVGGSSTAAGGTGTLTVFDGAFVTIGGTLKLWNSASGVSVTGAGSALAIAGLASEPGTASTINLGSGTALSVTNGLGTIFAGSITGAGALNKSGAGTLTLAGNNIYTGPTTVATGTLLVMGQTGGNSGTGTGPVEVNGGVLGGTGRVGGPVTVNSTALLAPGAGVGTLTVAGNTEFSAGGRLAVEVNASGTADLLVLEGTVTALKFTTGSILDVSLLGEFARTNPATYTLATLVNGDNILVDNTMVPPEGLLGSYIQGVGAGGAVVILPAGASLLDGDQFRLVRSGNTVELRYSPVPEPATVLAIALGTLTAGAAIRRRLRGVNR